MNASHIVPDALIPNFKAHLLPRDALDFRPEGFSLEQEVEAYAVGLWPRDRRRWDDIRKLNEWRLNPSMRWKYDRIIADWHSLWIFWGGPEGWKLVLKYGW